MLNMLRGFFERRPDQAERIYGAIVAVARQQRFYMELGVADSVDGRFEMIALHMFLILERLKGSEFQDLRQRLTDAFFLDMDRSLREMGTGDLSVGKKVRKMAEVFYGRVKAYGEAKDAEELVAAVARNVYAERDPAPARPLAQYITKVREALAKLANEAIVSGSFDLTGV